MAKADEAAVTTGTDAPTTTDVVAPAPAVTTTPVDAIADGPTDDYGSPYDKTAPPYSVYRDPTATAAAIAESERIMQEQSQANSRATAYVFRGPVSNTDGTRTIITKSGRVNVGETIKLPKEEVEHLLQQGFRFEKVS